ncbi:MAG: tnpA [Firmicutes bacterium]|nr:tnpA [Bacillota bacterium]
MVFDRHANLKYKYGTRTFWVRGYYVDTVGRNKKQIDNYIRNQLETGSNSGSNEFKGVYRPVHG